MIATPTPADEQAFLDQPLVENSALQRRGGLHFLTPDQAALLLIPNPASTSALLDIVRPMLDGNGS
jgi:iron complex transport system substrate-binding protein